MRSYRHRSLASEAEYFYLAHSIKVNERKAVRLPLREYGGLLQKALDYPWNRTRIEACGKNVEITMPKRRRCTGS